MKKLISILLALSLALSLAACGNSAGQTETKERMSPEQIAKALDRAETPEDLKDLIDKLEDDYEDDEPIEFEGETVTLAEIRELYQLMASIDSAVNDPGDGGSGNAVSPDTDSPAIGIWKGVYCKYVGDSEKNTSDPFALELRADGTGTHYRDEMSFELTWTLEGTDFAMTESFFGTIDYTGTLKDGELHIYNGDPEDALTYEYIYEAGDESDIAAATEGGASSTGATTDLGYDWWSGEWYGWWCITDATGVYERLNNIAWDAYAQISVYYDDTGLMVLWDSETSRNSGLCSCWLTFEPGTDSRGAMVADTGTFFDSGSWMAGSAVNPMEIGSRDWIADAGSSTVSHFENMIEIEGRYQDPYYPSEAFTYHIFLRPWGTDWEDVRTGDTENCLYHDMMPICYDDWYKPLIDLGVTAIPDTLEDGYDIIDSGTAPLNPADKAGAEGKVDLETLQRLLPWCKSDTSYSTTYDEIAAQFGVHGRQIESLFENKTIYRWWATEDDYIQITFDLHEDGAETWNVTQWSGIQ